MMANPIHELIRSVGNAWGFTHEIPVDRTRQAAAARMCCIVKLRSYGLSLHSIARIMMLDHTTVLYWIQKVPKELAQQIIEWDLSSNEETIEVIKAVNAFMAQRKEKKEKEESND